MESRDSLASRGFPEYLDFFESLQPLESLGFLKSMEALLSGNTKFQEFAYTGLGAKSGCEIELGEQRGPEPPLTGHLNLTDTRLSNRHPVTVIPPVTR